MLNPYVHETALVTVVGTGIASEQLLTALHGHRDWLIALLIYRHTRRLQHYLGHASITNTVRYTAMSPEPLVIW